MTTTDYILDSALVLLVLLQIKERQLTTMQMLRPIVIVGIAVADYFNGLSTAGNDLVLAAVLAAFGATIGALSGVTVFMRRDDEGHVLVRAGWASGVFWVLGMGSRFAFVYWLTHSGQSTIERFSRHHSITSLQAWTVALLAMAVCEVLARTAVLATRAQRTGGFGQPALQSA